MYKLLLCWRYLRTRYIALVSIVSVMLGVATLIATNAVMEGFSNELEVRTRGVLSDIIFESRSLNGIPDAEQRMKEIREVAGEYIDGMTPTVAVPAMLSFHWAGGDETRQITLIGVDEATYASASELGDHLQHAANREHLDFLLKDGGYDTIGHGTKETSKKRARPEMQIAGWPWRRRQASLARPAVAPEGSLDADPFRRSVGANPSTPTDGEGTIFDPARQQHSGCVLSISLCAYRDHDGAFRFLTLPGGDVEITFPSAGTPPRALSAKFTIVDVYENAVPELDANLAFVPIRDLQRLRGMIDPTTDIANFSSILIRAKAGANLDQLRDLLRDHFPPQQFAISTWRDKQGPLLAAVQVETAVLNVLLFLIIAVAGFSILAIFFMIVVEKTRDIGVLKSLGATGRGIMSIFLLYGLGLGIVGSGIGTALGLLIVHYINEIAEVIGWIFGQPIFDPVVYGLEKIPTIVHGLTVALVIFGAVSIAVTFSILPAWRAARLHPVEALRYE